MPTISIINLGIGNINSVKVAFSSLGASVELVEKATHFKSCDALVLPGVGNFRHAMEHLDSGGYVAPIAKLSVEEKIPFLGICLGMQLLAQQGEEGGHTKGLGLVPGKVLKLMDRPGFSVPHMGWDDITIKRREPLFAGLPEIPSFYFVHSYYFDAGPAFVTAACDYGSTFPVAVQKENVFGVQFHPEKSQKNGMAVLKNFLDYVKR